MVFADTVLAGSYHKGLVVLSVVIFDLRVARRTRPWPANGWRPGTAAPGMAWWLLICHGCQDPGHALHWHAGISIARAHRLRPAHGVAVALLRVRGFRRCPVRSQPPGDEFFARFRWKDH